MTGRITRMAWPRRPQRCLAVLGLVLGVLLAPGVRAANSARASSRPACSASPAASGALATTVATMEEAYDCLLAHYPTGSSLDDRLLLHGAMAGLVGYLLHRGLDQPTAVLPALSGDRTADWRAFRRGYLRIAAQTPVDAPVQEDMAQAAIAGMVASLHDDHARYAPPLAGGKTGAPAGGPVGSGDFGPGFRLSAGIDLPDRAAPPLFIVDVDPASPAARAGLRPGDVITAIDGLPPFVAGILDQAVLAQMDGPATLRLTIRRPGGVHTRTVGLAPAAYPAPQPVAARLLPGRVAYVRLDSFVDNAGNYVLAAIAGLGPHLRGLVLDLRGNGGGSAGEPARLLGAFVHGRVFAYYVDGHGRRTAARTDAGMPLLHLPLVALIDRGCASACDVTAAAIRDLHLGRLVGERTAGDAAGPAVPWFLDDGGVLLLPVSFMRGADGEIVDGIGVPPDDEAPVTADALASGRDPGIERALRDLR